MLISILKQIWENSKTNLNGGKMQKAKSLNTLTHIFWKHALFLTKICSICPFFPDNTLNVDIFYLVVGEIKNLECKSWSIFWSMLFSHMKSYLLFVVALCVGGGLLGCHCVFRSLTLDFWNRRTWPQKDKLVIIANLSQNVLCSSEKARAQFTYLVPPPLSLTPERDSACFLDLLFKSCFNSGPQVFIES